MYIRTTTRANKDGSTARYVQLAHNVWDPKARRSSVSVLFNFGRAEEVDHEALERLVASVRRFLGAETQLAGHADDDGFRYLGSRAYGGAWALDRLWDGLGIRSVVTRLLRERKYASPVERLLFALVANRALDPSSKLAVEEWAAKDVALPGIERIPVQQLYRAMDFLLEAGEQIQKEVFFSVAHLLNLEVDLLFFDTTSTYFETEGEDDFRRYGYSKDSRPDLPQVVIGFAVTREGIPVRAWSWPGNRTDVTVINEVKQDLVGWKLGRVVMVTDRGFVSEENLKTLQRSGGHYIVGERLRSGKGAVREALSRPGAYTPVKESLHVKEVVIGDGEARKRYVLAFNPLAATRSREEREGILADLRQRLKKVRKLTGGEHTKAHCALASHAGFARYLSKDDDGNLFIDEDKLTEDARLDGMTVLRTSDDTLSPEDVALGYRQLAEVEDAFRALKHTLDLRPVYHRKEERIRSHVLLCWLGLLLIRVAETRTGKPWRRLRDSLQRLRLGDFESPQGRMRRSSEPTKEQRQMMASMGVTPPPLIESLTPRRTKTKSP